MLKPLTGNKGEWGEIYVLFRLLADGKLYAADNNLNRIPNTYFPIIKIIREEKANELCEYFTGEQIQIAVNGEERLLVPSSEFGENADILFSLLKDKNISNKKGSFELQETELFMNKILVYKIKAPCTAIKKKFGGKVDITMRIQDNGSGVQSDTSFSIKSDFSSPSSLGNASEATNFIYQVEGITDEQMEAFNNIQTTHKVIDRMNYLKEVGGSIKYIKPYRQQAENNLLMVSNDMSELMGWILYFYYWEGLYSFRDIIARLTEENPFNYPNAEFVYTKRIKDFLYDCFAGLNLGLPWTGSRDVSGGYIVIKDNGEVLAYHNYIQDTFTQFLLNHCRLDKGGTRKHKYGVIYKENGKHYLKLNLQIRFQ